MPTAQSLESLFGSTITLSQQTPLFVASRNHQLLTEIYATEFNATVARVNETKPYGLDPDLTPNLVRATTRLRDQRTTLPTLAQIARQADRLMDYADAVDGTFEDINNNYRVPRRKGRWSWLSELSGRDMIGASILEIWTDILERLPKFSRKNDEPQKMWLLATEEALGTDKEDLLLDRVARQWYTVDEGFTPDYVDYTQLRQILNNGVRANRAILNRQQMPEVHALISSDPRFIVNLARDLNTAIQDLNQSAKEGNIDPLSINTKAVAPILREQPLPTIIGPDRVDCRKVSVLRSTANRMNRAMRAGESGRPWVPGSDHFKFHVVGTSPEAILTALVFDGYVVSTEEQKQQPRFSDEALINAICEVLAVKAPHSQSFNYLYNSEHGLDWYNPSWGFDPRFTARLAQS